MQLRMDVADVIIDLRPAARIIVKKGDEARECAAALLSSSLHVVVGSSCQILATEHGFADHLIDTTGGENSFVRLYVSKERKLAEVSEQADNSVDDASLGRSLGYPECCVQAILKNGGVPTVLASLKMYSCDGYYDPYAWPASNLFDASLVPHFPCSMGCVRTHEIAKRRMQFLTKFDRIWDTRFAEHFIKYNSLKYPADANFYPWDPDQDTVVPNLLFPLRGLIEQDDL